MEETREEKYTNCVCIFVQLFIYALRRAAAVG